MGIKCELEGCDNVARGIGYGRRGRLCSTHHRQRYPRNRGHRKRSVLSARRQRLRAYGLTEATYSGMVAEQQGCCSICGEQVTLNIDHCHNEGHVRGLLCTKCNWGLGMFNDDIDLLASATSYLINSRVKECG